MFGAELERGTERLTGGDHVAGAIRGPAGLDIDTSGGRTSDLGGRLA
jgi:hypothetical protein